MVSETFIFVGNRFGAALVAGDVDADDALVTVAQAELEDLVGPLRYAADAAEDRTADQTRFGLATSKAPVHRLHHRGRRQRRHL